MIHDGRSPGPGPAMFPNSDLGVDLASKLSRDSMEARGGPLLAKPPPLPCLSYVLVILDRKIHHFYILQFIWSFTSLQPSTQIHHKIVMMESVFSVSELGVFSRISIISMYCPCIAQLDRV